MDSFAHLAFAAKSDIGRKRKNNEDAFGTFPSIGVFCVADGMGGGDDGEVASAATVRALEAFANKCRFPAAAAYAQADVIAGLRANLNGASSWIAEMAKRKRLNGCGSTFVGVCFDATRPDAAAALHAGDSRLYLISGKSIRQITRDHSAAELIGAKDENEINPMFRGMILRAVGIQPTVNVDVTPFTIREGDRILICSDGLTRMVPDGQLLKIVCGADSVGHAVEALVSAANEAGGVDNVTAVLIAVGKLPDALPAAKMPQGMLLTETFASKLPVESPTGNTDSDNGFACGANTSSEGFDTPAATTVSEENAHTADTDKQNAAATNARGVAKRPRTISGLFTIFSSVIAVTIIGAVAHSVLNGKVDVLADGREETLSDEGTPPLPQKSEPQPTSKPDREIVAATVAESHDDSDELELQRKRIAVLEAFEEACGDDAATAFVRKVDKLIRKEMPDSIYTRFRPLSGRSRLSLEKKIAAAQALTRDVQIISGRLMHYVKVRSEAVEMELRDPMVAESRKNGLNETAERMTSFCECARQFVAGDPTNPDVQLKCVMMIVSVPHWL